MSLSTYTVCPEKKRPKRFL